MIEAVFTGCAQSDAVWKRERYAGPDYTSKGRQGAYFPDVLIDAFAGKAAAVASGTFARHIARPAEFGLLTNPAIEAQPISVVHAKTLIIHALTDFVPELGQRAADILNNPERLNLHDVPAGQGRMMRVRAAGLAMAPDHDMRLENSGLPDEVIADLRTRYPDDENLGGQEAIIDFDYDGTIGAVIYLAHELGHALADDSQVRAGWSNKDNPAHMEETQAYLVQNIVVNHLKTHCDPQVAMAATRFYTADMTANLYDMSLSMIAKDLLDVEQGGQDRNRTQIFQSRFGQNWEQFVQEYPPGQSIFGAATDLTTDNRAAALQTLNDEYGRIHFRPMSIYSGAALADYLLDQDMETRLKVTETVFGRYGPKFIEDAIQTAGIGRIDHIAGQTVDRAMSYISDKDAEPKQCEPCSPKAGLK